MSQDSKEFKKGQVWVRSLTRRVIVDINDEMRLVFYQGHPVRENDGIYNCSHEEWAEWASFARREASEEEMRRALTQIADEPHTGEWARIRARETLRPASPARADGGGR